MYKYNLALSFEDIVNRYQNNIALKFSNAERVTYGELNSMANQCARLLQSMGVKSRDVVCIAGDKQLSTFACIIACLKTGAIYSILDPDSPTERLAKIIKRCRPRLLFINADLANHLADDSRDLGAVILHNQPKSVEQAIRGFAGMNLMESRKIPGSNPAYIMFTSGSTGFPKGAVMTHDNVLNFIDWNIDTFQFTSHDILTNVNPLYFDNTVFDFYSALFTGACLVPFSKETVTNPKTLASQIDELCCTSWFSVPSLLIFLQTMKALNKNNMRSIKKIIFGGEGYPKAKLKSLFDMYSDRVALFNVYGPTECTCMCSSYQLSSKDFDDLQGFPPLGEIANNFSYMILDDDMQPAAPNAPGELFLLGPNVGKGYYNDTDRTRESFSQNPFNKNYREIMYKTGDIVKYNPEDGKLYILGRKDHQIKHMGYRIELEEIETALSHLDYVSQAAVVHGNVRGLSQIIAVISANRDVDEKIIRHDLAKMIPHYMIPTLYHFENVLPKNPNGKIDRRKLEDVYLSR